MKHKFTCMFLYAMLCIMKYTLSNKAINLYSHYYTMYSLLPLTKGHLPNVATISWQIMLPYLLERDYCIYIHEYLSVSYLGSPLWKVRVPGGKEDGDNVLLTAIVTRLAASNIKNELTSASNGRWPPTCVITCSPLTN